MSSDVINLFKSCYFLFVQYILEINVRKTERTKNLVGIFSSSTIELFSLSSVHGIRTIRLQHHFWKASIFHFLPFVVLNFSSVLEDWDNKVSSRFGLVRWSELFIFVAMYRLYFCHRYSALCSTSYSQLPLLLIIETMSTNTRLRYRKRPASCWTLAPTTTMVFVSDVLIYSFPSQN